MNMKNKPIVIVGITTWKGRTDHYKESVFNCLKSLDNALALAIHDQVISDKSRIELNLDHENYPTEEVPLTLRKINYLDVYWQDKDYTVWNKNVPSIRRHKGEDYILITADDDVIYPEDYIEQCVDNVKGYDWLCSQDDSMTGGEYMVYSSSILNKIEPYLTDDLITRTKLDDHTLYHLMAKFNARRGHKINSKCDDMLLGYSFRRLFNKDKNPAECKKTTSGYDMKYLVEERKVLKEKGIV